MEYASHDKPFPANGFSHIVASYANDGAAGYDNDDGGKESRYNQSCYN